MPKILTIIIIAQRVGTSFAFVVTKQRNMDVQTMLDAKSSRPPSPLDMVKIDAGGYYETFHGHRSRLVEREGSQSRIDTRTGVHRGFSRLQQLAGKTKHSFHDFGCQTVYCDSCSRVFTRSLTVARLGGTSENASGASFNARQRLLVMRIDQFNRGIPMLITAGKTERPSRTIPS